MESWKDTAQKLLAQHEAADILDELAELANETLECESGEELICEYDLEDGTAVTVTLQKAVELTAANEGEAPKETAHAVLVSIAVGDDVIEVHEAL